MSDAMPISRTFLLTTAAMLVVAVGAEPGAAQTAPKGELPLVWVLSTGGTIAGSGGSATDLSNYKSGALRGEDIVNAVPQIRSVANVKVEQIVNVSSSDITLANWLTIANRINDIYAADPKVAGIVVTHGTGTLEETAYFLNLTVKYDRPVVLVGSMRPATAISADGPLNLLNAIRTAAAPDARGKGVLVVMNDEINAAHDVTKTNTYRVDTFRAPELGVLGYVHEDKVTFYHSPTKKHTSQSEFDVSAVKVLPKVEILYFYVEPDISLIQALVSSGTKGIVFAGTSAGILTSVATAALKPLLSTPSGSRPVLVRSSRVGNGRVLAREDYDAMGMIPADTLNPQKARILLMLALTKTSDLREIGRMFTEY